MSNWHGPAGKGAMKKLQELKRQEAAERNAATPPERRSLKRGLSQAMRGRPAAEAGDG